MWKNAQNKSEIKVVKCSNVLNPVNTHPVLPSCIAELLKKYAVNHYCSQADAVRKYV